MAERTLQRNNGSPRGFGQPNRRPNVRNDMANVIMRPEDREIFGSPSNPEPYGPDPVVPGQVTADDNYAKAGADPRHFPTRPDLKQPEGSIYGAGAGPSQGALTRDQRDALRSGATGSVGTLAGFRMDDYGGDTKARTSVKNMFAALARDYANTPEGLRQLAQDPRFAQWFPGARLVEGGAGDKIDFGSLLSDYESGVPVGIVDVGQGFDPRSNTGQAWWWGHGAGASPQGGPQGSGTSIYNRAPVFQRSPNQLTPPPAVDPMTGRQPTSNTEDFLQWLMMQQQSPLV